MIWPSQSCCFLSLIQGGGCPWQVFGSVLLLIAITLAVFQDVKRSPYLATGWLWYIGTLVACHRYRAGLAIRPRADRLHLYSPDRVIHHGAWGVPILEKMETPGKKYF